MNALKELLTAGKRLGARAEAERLLAKNPGDAEALVTLAKAHLVEGETESAERVIARAELAGGETADTLVVRGALAAERYELDPAFALYKQASEKNPKLAEAQFSMGAMLAEQRRFEESLPFMERAVKLAPKSGVLHYHLAQNLIRVDRHKEAVEHLQRAIELHPLYPNPYRLLAKILCILGRPREARELLEKGLQAIPGDAALREELVNTMVLAGDVGAAAQLAEQISKGRPDDPVAQANRAVTLFAQGRVGDGLKVLKEAQARGVVSGAMKLAEGMALQAMNPPDIPGAIRAYEEGMALDPEGWEAPNNLGLLLLQQGEPKAQAVERAVTVLTEAMRRSPSQPEVLLNLALAHVRKDERPRALELAQKVVLLDLPKDNPAREQAERLVAKLAPKA